MNDKTSMDEKEFRKNFEYLKEKRIVLYGAGRLTHKLLPRIKDYNIVGILDSNLEKVGTILEHIPVRGLEEVVEDYADCIIINTSELYWKQIFLKLKNINVPIYYRNGKQAVSKIAKENIFEKYSEKKISKNHNQILELLEKNEAIKRGEFSNWQDWGYCLYGPVVWSFFHWLAQNVKEDGIEQVLFLARDGYLLIDEYEHFINVNEVKLPKAIYFPSSRRLTCVAAIDSEEDLKNIISYSYKGNFEDFLWKRFHIKVQENDQNKNHEVSLPKDAKKVCDWLKRYEIQIKQEINREKKEYLEYIKKLEICTTIGVVDLGFYGTLSYYLQKLLPNKKIKTYYFNGDFSIGNKYTKNGLFKACFQTEEDINAFNSKFRKYLIQNEAVFTAPYGMMERIENQKIVNVPMKIDFSINQLINEGIKSFIKDISNYQICVDKKLLLFIDELFGHLNETVDVTEELMIGLHYIDTWSS